MKTYRIRYLPICFTPGEVVRDILVQAENETKALLKIPEMYSAHFVEEAAEECELEVIPGKS